MTRTKHLFIGLAMLAAAGLAVAITPREKIADHGPKVDLETMIPKQLGEWRMDENIMPLQVSPDVKAKLDRIYNQTLSRTYINTQGERIMLSIAYGGDQSDSMQVHKPEVCYPAQGFQVIKQMQSSMETSFYPIPIVKLVAVQNNRIEPITYWVKIGDKVPASGTARKIEQLKYGLTGNIPDGMLFRVSSLSPDHNGAFRLHAVFVNALLNNVDKDVRERLIGNGN